MTDKAEWLAGLEVGDLVWIRWSSGKDARFQWVARLTKTRITTEDGSWFRRRDGKKPSGCGCCWRQIEQPTAVQARRAKR